MVQPTTKQINTNPCMAMHKTTPNTFLMIQHQVQNRLTINKFLEGFIWIDEHEEKQVEVYNVHTTL